MIGSAARERCLPIFPFACRQNIRHLLMVAQVDADVAHFLTMTSQEKIHRNQFRPGRFYARCSAMPIIRNANFDTKDSRFLPGLGGKDEFFG